MATSVTRNAAFVAGLLLALATTGLRSDDPDGGEKTTEVPLDLIQDDTAPVVLEDGPNGPTL